MDKNSIIGIVLIAAIFVVMGVLNQPSEEEKARIQWRNDSIAKVEREQERLYEERSVQNTNSQAIDSSTLVQKEKKYGTFGTAVYGENKFYTIENDLLELTVSSKGGRPYSVRLKNYQSYDSLPLHLFDGDSTIFNLQFYNNGSVSTNDLFFTLNIIQQINI